MRLTAKRALAVGGVGVIVAAVVLVVLQFVLKSAPVPAPVGWGPLPHHVRVEVWNASDMTGAARLGRLALQHAGLDVVQSANADDSLRGTANNRIFVRLGDTVGVGRVIEVLGGADVEMKPDRTRIVDLTVILGSKFVPPIDRFNSSQ